MDLTQYVSVDYMLRTTWNSVIKMYNKEAAEYDATMVIALALIAVDPEKGTPSTMLGPRMGMEPTSLSRTLKTLEERNYIQRSPNPKDGRSVIISLTEEGRKKQVLSKEKVRIFNAKIEEAVGQENLKTFLEVAETIKEKIKNNEIFTDK